MNQFKYDHSDFCHCSDYDAKKCPKKCFRARLTKELREADPPYPYPVSMVNFFHSGECPLHKEETNG